MQFIKGMDVSMLKELEARGASYYYRNQRDDLFHILKKCGTDMVRLRLWADPYDADGKPYGGGVNDLQTTIELAERAVEAGMSYLLDFHYSDFWADPGKQIKPKTWEALNGKELETAVYLHTADTLKALKNRGLSPAMIQIGNEITNGLLWPEGHFDNVGTMAKLLKAGIRGVRRELKEAKIVLHLDFGTDNALYRKWFDALMPYELDFDVIGMSYYPHFNGSIELLSENMNDVSARYKKDVLVAETSIGYTTDTFSCSGLVFTEESAQATGYLATPEGQEAFLKDLCAAVKSVPDGRGLGVFYWEPAWLPIPDCKWASAQGTDYMRDQVEAGNSMANQALFDAAGNANPALLKLAMM